MPALKRQGPFSFRSYLRHKGKVHSVLNHACAKKARSIQFWIVLAPKTQGSFSFRGRLPN